MEGMLSLILERGKEPSLYTLCRDRSDKEKNGKGIWREKGARERLEEASPDGRKGGQRNHRRCQSMWSKKGGTKY
jgi:hypothetical protein